MDERKRKSAHWLVQVSVGAIIAALAAIVFAPLAAPISNGETHVWTGLDHFWVWFVHLNWFVIGLFCLFIFVCIIGYRWRVRHLRERQSMPSPPSYQPPPSYEPSPPFYGDYQPPLPPQQYPPQRY